MKTHTLALVTGASSGLGRALSIALALRGISLILVARNRDALEQLAATLSVPTEILPADLASPDGRKRVIEKIRARTPDLIINNAGFGLYGPVLSHPLSAWDEMLAVNAQAVMDLTIAGAENLKKWGKKGTILNIASAAAFFSYPSFCVYAATKAFVMRFSEALHTELRPSGIAILTACPGQIDTPFRQHASLQFSQKKDRRTLPLEKAVVFLLDQIDREKPLLIFDWKYRAMIAFSRLIPKRWLQTFLNKSLRDRIRSIRS